MKKWTFENCKKVHREVWGWLAKTGKEKVNYPKWNKIEKEFGELPVYDCTACQYVGREYYETNFNKCKKCPITWLDSDKNEITNLCATPCTVGEFGYFNSFDIGTKERKRIAKIIANKKWVDKRKNTA